MELIGKSSLFVEKYRPQTVKDLILPDNVKTYFQNMVNEGEISNILLCGSAGLGKTSTAFAICKDLDADVLYVNASLESGIDTIRSKVQSFAYTGSFSEGKKIVILDELDSSNGIVAAQLSLKALMEQTESNCRYIITTNNLPKIIEPIQSRCQITNFNFSPKETKNLMVNYFKRVCWILEQEKIKYEKKSLAELVQKLYPDFRKTLNTLQQFSKMYGEINESIFSTLDDSLMNNLIEEMKNKKFNAVRKIAVELDPSDFYINFYNQIDSLVQDSCKPDIIIQLADGAYRASNTVCKELQLVASCIELMKTALWR